MSPSPLSSRPPDISTRSRICLQFRMTIDAAILRRLRSAAQRGVMKEKERPDEANLCVSPLAVLHPSPRHTPPSLSTCVSSSLISGCGGYLGSKGRWTRELSGSLLRVHAGIFFKSVAWVMRSSFSLAPICSLGFIVCSRMLVCL